MRQLPLLLLLLQEHQNRTLASLTQNEVRAVVLQRRINSTIAGAAQAAQQSQQQGRGLSWPASVLAVEAGDYVFNTSLVIHGARNFRLTSVQGPGSVNLWFTIGAGVLIKQCEDVSVEDMSIDYDPPAHWQGTIIRFEGHERDSSNTTLLRAVVRSDRGFVQDPADFQALDVGPSKRPWVMAHYGPVLWNASDSGFGSYATASLVGPFNHSNGTSVAGEHLFSIPWIGADGASTMLCNKVMTGGGSCATKADGALPTPQIKDKLTIHLRGGITYHVLNSSRVSSRNVAIHGATGFAITEYDGEGAHVYRNVTVGRRPQAKRHRPKQPHEQDALGDEHARETEGAFEWDNEAMCGVDNPGGGRLCLGLIASNNDAFHSSGCKRGPHFSGTLI